MKTPVEVELEYGGPWVPAELTDEREYGHTVVAVAGERGSKGPLEVLCIRAVPNTDRRLLDSVRALGYRVTEA